jgi:hypothetical protein
LLSSVSVYLLVSVFIVCDPYLPSADAPIPSALTISPVTSGSSSPSGISGITFFGIGLGSSFFGGSSSSSGSSFGSSSSFGSFGFSLSY